MNRWRTLDRTAAGRPSLSDNEAILFVQNSVGLYDGYTLTSTKADDSKFKSPNHQDGTVYLTTHRVCYVDEIKPMLYSTGVDLSQIAKIETSVLPSLAPYHLT
jgi:ESCRT-II complex subunit VPS36